MPMPTVGSTSVPVAPGSGGYNGSTVTGSVAAPPTGTLTPPKPTASFTGGALHLHGGIGLEAALMLVLGLCFLL